MRIVDLLPGVDEGQAALEVVEGRPVAAHGLLREDVGRAGAVMIFKEAELDIVVRIEPFLGVQPVGVLCKGDGAFEIVAEVGVDVVVIGGIERLIELGVGQACKALRAGTWKPRSTDSHSQKQPGRTVATSARARFQNSSGTSGATSQRKPSTRRAQVLSVSIW